MPDNEWIQCNMCMKVYEDLELQECEECQTDAYLYTVAELNEPWGLNASRGYSIYGQETGLHDSNFVHIDSDFRV